MEEEMEDIKVKEEEEEMEENNKIGKSDNMVNIQIKPREKRVKERTIGYVREKVVEWRKYYKQGYTDLNGEFVKMNLDLAANMVGLSRKTLDDYFA